LEKSDREFSSSSSERENNEHQRVREKKETRVKENRNNIHSYRHLDSPGRLAADFHVEKDNWVRHSVNVFLLCKFVVKKVKEPSKTQKEIFSPLCGLSPFSTKC
tara:strand:+ start:116 stop:427 length:312 start_codon:yes stop_codon:yes gene_type:complete